MIALTAADTAIHVEGDQSLLPITQFAQIAAFAVIDEAEADAATTWFQSLAQATELNVDFGFIDGSIEESDLKSLSESVVDAELVVFAFFGKAVAFRNTIGGLERLPEIMARLAGEKPVIIVACGSPYGIDSLPAQTRIYTYSDTLPSLAASVMRLIGKVVSKN